MQRFPSPARDENRYCVGRGALCHSGAVANIPDMLIAGAPGRSNRVAVVSSRTLLSCRFCIRRKHCAWDVESFKGS